MPSLERSVSRSNRTLLVGIESWQDGVPRRFENSFFDDLMAGRLILGESETSGSLT